MSPHPHAALIALVPLCLLQAVLGFQTSCGSIVAPVAGRGFLSLRPKGASLAPCALSDALACAAPTRRRLRLGNGTPSSKLAMAASLADMVAAAGNGDTITLEKGTYILDKMLTIEKDLSIEASQDCAWGDVLLTATAPLDSGHFAARKDGSLGIMINCKGLIPEPGDSGKKAVLPEIKFKGIKLHHAGGSERGSLSNGLGSICVAIGSGARVTFEECEVMTDTSTAVFCSGQFSQVKVDTCVIGPNGWETESASGYGVCIFREAYGEVINSDVWRQAQSGVIAFNEGSTALVVNCEVGPCLLGGIAAEGQRATLTAKDVALNGIEWREVAQFDGGEVIFKDGVEGDEMCPHFRQKSKCWECEAGRPPTSYSEF